MKNGLEEMMQLPIEQLTTERDRELLARVFNNAHADADRPIEEVLGGVMHAAFVIGRWSRETLS